MLLMLAISLMTFKTYKTKENNSSFSVLNQQFAMSIMMAAAVATDYVTAVVVNAQGILKKDAIYTVV